jgi:pimeloyl-ACP methyl ester carboxylesterase
MTEDNPISRREFASIAAGISAASLAASALQAQTATSEETATQPPLDLAEWSYFWVGADRGELAKGTYVNGKQMYVEYWAPTEVRHPYPMVLVHGGGGQGTDWMGTPDGRRGWATILVEQGFKVYVVDRPGHGRSPFHPDLHGPFPLQAGALEFISGRFTPPNPTSPNKPLPFQHFHNQWVGTGEVGSPDLDQFVASQGGSYVAAPTPPGARPGANPLAAIGAATAGPPPLATLPVNFPGAAFTPTVGQDTQHMVWRNRGAELLDKIGPAIIMTHSAGGPFGWLVAEIRPNLVKGIIAIEGGGQPFVGPAFIGGNIWGMSSIPVEYDPPVSDPSEIKKKLMPSPEEGVSAYYLQGEPARKLKNLQGIPIVMVTSEGSFASPGNPAAVAFFRQAGCQAEELRLVNHNIHGNGHMMMVERNNREVLQPIVEWIAKNVEKNAPKPSVSPGETAVKLADQGFFWVGTEHKKMPYGTILTGQMYVQYLVPAQIRHPYPVVLVHGGSGQMLHYMGVGDGKAGWAHYYLQAGYRVYLVDRPGHGRAPYHPDALGPIAPQPTYALLAPDLLRAATGPNKKWPGTGTIGDPLLDGLMASQNAPPQDNAMAHRLWATRGAELLDKIGPAIIQVHSAGGPFGYLVANERPNLVKAIVNVEGGGAPFGFGGEWGVTDIPLAYDPPVSDPSQFDLREVTPASGPRYKLQADGKVHKLKNLQGIPIVYVSAEKSGRSGVAHVAFLKQAGCDADDLPLKDKGILGNGHFMMLESNRKEVFDVIQGWVEQKVKA